MIEASSRHDAFVLNLIAGTPAEKKCPHLRKDDNGAYCGKGLQSGMPPTDERRMVCDAYSVQLWCLDSVSCHNCIWYKGEPFRQE